MPHRVTGLFVAVEGPNGVGKSTVVEHAGPLLEQQLGVHVWATKEPSRTALGRAIRELEPSFPREALALACAADRADHLAREIEPAVARGELVLSDRYLPSSLVLQQLDGLELEWIMAINKSVPAADLTLFIEDEAGRIIERLRSRGSNARFESEENTVRELALYRQAREYLEGAGWKVRAISAANLDVAETAASFVAAVRDFAAGRA
jgi:dTMP kinase